MPFTKVRRHLRNLRNRRPAVVSAHYRKTPSEVAARQEWASVPPEVLYHVTSIDRLQSILKRGLVPLGAGAWGNYPHLGRRNRGKVYLTPDDDMIEHFGVVSTGENVNRPKPKVVLAVYTHGLHLFRGWSYGGPNSGGGTPYSRTSERYLSGREWFSTDTIPADRIRVWRYLPSSIPRSDPPMVRHPYTVNSPYQSPLFQAQWIDRSTR